MAVTIKLKNASGSDPSASDLVVGEVAIRTDNGKLFTKKDDNSVAEISGGGGIDDGDKGDITVSNSGGTFTIDNDVVTFAKMQNIFTQTIMGRLSNGTGDATMLNASDVRTIINVENGATADQTASEIRALVESASDSNVFTDADHTKLNGLSADTIENGTSFVSVSNNANITISRAGSTRLTATGAGVEVTGNISVSGTVDGRDLATDGSKLDGIESGATADQSASEILTLIKTVDGSGSGLDGDKLDGQEGSYYRNASNLNAGTISDDRLPATISSDITGSAATLTNARSIAGSSFNGSASIDIDYNNLTNLPTIPSNTNQLTNGAGFITATLTNEQVQDIVGGMVSGNTESGISVTYNDSGNKLNFSVSSQTDNNFTTTLKNKLDGIASGATNVTNNNQISNGAGYVTSSVINSLNASNLSSGTIPDARFPSTLPAVSGANLTNISATVAGGAVYENAQSITSNYTVTNGKNAMSAGPISIASGVTVTVGSGETYTIV